jgi:hypothetical protein
MTRIVTGFGRPAIRLAEARFNILTKSIQACRMYLRIRVLQSLVAEYRAMNLYVEECRLQWVGLRTRLLPDPVLSHIM